MPEVWPFQPDGLATLSTVRSRTSDKISATDGPWLDEWGQKLEERVHLGRDPRARVPRPVVVVTVVDVGEVGRLGAQGRNLVTMGAVLKPG